MTTTRIHLTAHLVKVTFFTYGHGVPLSYDPAEYPRFAVAADLVVLTVRHGSFSVLLIERGVEPFAGIWALPGGFTRPDESVEDAAYRELTEEAGVRRGQVVLEQLRTYGDPHRDPRMRVVSVAWVALGADLPDASPGGDAARAAWRPVSEALAMDLAFDHHSILDDGVERARAKLEYTTLATAFLPEQFTVAELRGVYEAIWGAPLDPSNFHRKVSAAADFLVDTGERTTGGIGRPARLYRAGTAAGLHPPVLRR